MRSHISSYEKGTEKKKWKKRGGWGENKDPEEKSTGKTVQRSQSKTRNADSHMKLTGAGNEFFCRASKGSSLTNTLQTSGLQNGERKLSVTLSHPACGHVLQQPQGTKPLVRVIAGH